MRAVSFSTKCLSFFVAFSLIFNIIYTPPLLSTAINTRSNVIQPTYNDLPSIDDEIAYRKLLRSAQESFGFEDVLDLIDRIEEGHLETLSHKQLLQIGKTLIHFAKLGTKKEDYYAHAVLDQEAVELSHNFSTNSLYYCCAPQLVEYQVIPAMGNYAYEYMLCKSKAFSKFKKFVKKHKKPIIIGAAVVVFVTIVVCTGGTGTAAAGIAGAAGAAGAGIDSSQKKSNSNHTNRPDVISKAQRSPEKANETSIASKQEDEIHESIQNFNKIKRKNEPNKSFILNDSQLTKLDKEHHRLTQDTHHAVQYPHLEKTNSHPNAPPKITYNPPSNHQPQKGSYIYSQLDKAQLTETTQNLLLEDPNIQEASPNDQTFLQKMADAGSGVLHALADEIIREAAIPMAQGIDETYDLMERFRDKTYISTRENRASDNVEKISDQIHSAIDSAFKTNYKEIYPTPYQKNHQDTFTHGTLPPPSNWGSLFKGKDLSKGWKPGQPVFNRMKDGTLPSPEIVKSRYWKNQAQNNPNKYSPNNLKRLQQGQPPQHHLKRTGETFTKDLKPVPTRKNDGSYKLKEFWPEKRNVTVYQSVNEQTGEVKYVGITNDIKRRGREHYLSKRIEIKPIKGLSGLTKSEARCVEQTLIEMHKLEKEGGTLINKINSISNTNPDYAKSLEKGFLILKEKGVL